MDHSCSQEHRVIKPSGQPWIHLFGLVGMDSSMGYSEIHSSSQLDLSLDYILNTNIKSIKFNININNTCQYFILRASVPLIQGDTR